MPNILTSQRMRRGARLLDPGLIRAQSPPLPLTIRIIASTSHKRTKSRRPAILQATLISPVITATACTHPIIAGRSRTSPRPRRSALIAPPLTRAALWSPWPLAVVRSHGNAPQRIRPNLIDSRFVFIAGSPPTPNFEVDLTTWLAANVAEAVYPVHIPQQTDSTTSVLPCCTYKRLGSDRLKMLARPSGKVKARIEIETYSLLYDDIASMTLTLVQTLHGYRGMMGNTKVSLAFLEDDFDGDDPPVNASDKWTFHRVFQF